MAVKLRWLDQLFDRRWYDRIVASDVMAFYWEGGRSTRHTVRNISLGGAYIEADVHFYVGTWLMVTLQRGEDLENPVACVTVPCEIVRHGVDGIGVKFMLTNREERAGVRQIVGPEARDSSPKPAFSFGAQAPLVRKKRCSGQSVVEFSVISLALLAMLFGVIEVCRFVLVCNTLGNGARVGVRYAMVHGTTAQTPAHSVTCDQIAAVVNGYLSAATVQAGGGCSTTSPCPPGPACIRVTPSNPGAAGTKITVNVSYRYNPLTSYFPGFDLSSTSQGFIVY